MYNSLLRGAALATGLVLFVACATDSPSAPRVAPTQAPSASLLGSLTGTLTSAKGAQRATPLASSISVSQTVGSLGGTLSIPQAGVTVVVPAGALAAPTLLTMTARSGSLIAYDFAPHGITFAQPLVLTQNLSGTNVSVLTAPLLQLGYYSDPSLLTAVGGTVSELIGGTVNLLSWTFTSPIKHFSGYMIAVGRSDE